MLEWMIRYVGSRTLDSTVVQTCLATLPLRDRYASNRNDLLGEFYAPCLDNATSYDRAVGYFRSSVLLLAARPLADFAVRHGAIRIVCCPELTKDDIDAAEKGYQWRDSIRDALIRQIDQALADAVGELAMVFLATLIAVGSLDIRIAFRPGFAGIFHDKVGLFADLDGHTVSFTGSANETAFAWNVAGNHELFDVFRSWTADANRVAQHRTYFDDVWRGVEPGLEVIDFPAIARDRLVEVADPDGVQAAYAKLARTRVQTTKTPQIHQMEAIRSWEANGNRGIVDHATGGGKTITAIAAMRMWLSSRGPVIVVVPTRLLLDQWLAEVSAELEALDPRLLLVGAGNDGWRRADVLEAFTAPTGTARVTLATMQTASTAEFRARLNQGDHLLLVADEVHRVGSPAYSDICTIDAGGRLGLSATPRRYGDPSGTARIFKYFGDILNPPFTLHDGIVAGRLCTYSYQVHFVQLNADERKRWGAISKELAREIARHSPARSHSIVMSDNAKRLAIRRAAIVKAASAKPAAARDILRSSYAPGQRWLVYCDDQSQLRETVRLLDEAGIACSEYHSAMDGDPATTLQYFALAGGVLVAIRCLDEGVNVPNADHALILASSPQPTRVHSTARPRSSRLREQAHSTDLRRSSYPSRARRLARRPEHPPRRIGTRRSIRG